MSHSTTAAVRQYEMNVNITLPTLPLWLRVDLCVPLPLETSYTTASHALRIPLNHA